MHTFFQDLRFAGRMLWKNPSVTCLAVLCLALGISANSTVFSLVDGFWLRPLPVERPQDLIALYTTVKGQPSGLSYPEYLDYRNQSQTVAGLTASARFGPELSDGEVERTLTTVASENYFQVLGVKAALGRVFTEADAKSAEPVLVMNYGLWQRRYGGDPKIVGRRVVLSGRSFTVIGIAPRNFRGTERQLDVDLWVPAHAWGDWEAARNDRVFRDFEVLGRLRRGTTKEQARVEMEGIAKRLEQAYPATNRGYQAGVSQFNEAGMAPYLVLGIVGLVLLIACANVANLLLGRAESRRREIGIRQAMGAGRTRIVGQLLTESALLGAIAVAAALLLSAWLIALLPSVVIPPSNFRAGYQFVMDERVFGFTLLASVGTVLVFGLVPALRASRTEVMGTLKNEHAARRSGRLSDLLVICQVALSLVLLSGAGLLLRAYLNGQRLDLGFQRKDLLLVSIYPNERPQQAQAFFDELLARIRSLPGVRRVTLASRPPMWLSEGGRRVPVTIPGYTAPDGATRFRIRNLEIEPTYFRALGVRLLSGREFDARDNGAGTRVAIVNETMARRFWPHANPIGKVIRVEGQSGVTREIVGVAHDTKINSPDEGPDPYLYLPFAQTAQNYGTVMVETAGGAPLQQLAAVKAQIAALDKRVRVYESWTMKDLIRFHFFDRESSARIVGTLGMLGLVLAMVGLYGVVAYTVAQRTHEIGIRMALGATRSDALKLVLRHGLMRALAGVALGLAAASAVTPLLSRMLYGVRPRDPATLGVVAVLMLVVAAMASYFPARRATAVEPMAALRYE